MCLSFVFLISLLRDVGAVTTGVIAVGVGAGTSVVGAGEGALCGTGGWVEDLPTVGIIGVHRAGHWEGNTLERRS